ncbi:MAG: DUF488 domain-containing protein [Thermodesulfobacteriota bacterium]
MVKTRSIYDPASKDEGVRVLVTRYWPRGVKKERQDYWFRDLGPAPELIKAWKAGGLEWDEFVRRYRAEFSSMEKMESLSELKSLVKEARGKVTLLCTCRDERCHRVLLKEMLARRWTFSRSGI